MVDDYIRGVYYLHIPDDLSTSNSKDWLLVRIIELQLKELLRSGGRDESMNVKIKTFTSSIKWEIFEILVFEKEKVIPFVMKPDTYVTYSKQLEENRQHYDYLSMS